MTTSNSILRADLPQVNGVAFQLVNGFYGYAVGDDGSFWSCLVSSANPRGGWWQKATPLRNGYKLAALQKDNRSCFVYVHTLVLTAFFGPRPDGMECCHEDGSRTNNALSNLRWDTPSANKNDERRHGILPLGSRRPNSKLTEESTELAIELLVAKIPVAAIARHLGVRPSTVWCIVLGKSWTHVLPHLPRPIHCNKDALARGGNALIDSWLAAHRGVDK